MKNFLFKLVNQGELFCRNNSNKFFVLLVIFCCVYILWVSYFRGVYISPDSAFYLREAENLYHGKGFNYNGLAGGKDWFSLFPIMYPFLISVVMKITTCNAYLSSKLLACVSLVLLAVVIKRNTKNPFIYSPIFLNFGFIWCSLITLSESIFILFVVLTVFSLNSYLSKQTAGFADLLAILIWGYCSFLTRYYGAFFCFLFLFFILVYFIKWILKKEKLYFRRMISLISLEFIFVLICLLYFMLNSYMSGYGSGGERFIFKENYFDLTLDLIRALFDEVYGLFGSLILGLIRCAGSPIVLDMFTGLIIAVVVKNFSSRIRIKSFDSVSKTFIIAGMIYYVIFIVYRYMSTMDHFYYRFFVPGTILLLIAVLNQLMKSKRKYLYLSMGIYVLFVAGSYAILGATYYNGDGYKEATRKWNDLLKVIEPQSVVLFSYSNIGFPPSMMWLRSDILLYNIDNADSIQNMVLKYPNRDIYIDKEILDRKELICLKSSYEIDSTNTNGLFLLRK